MQRRRRRSAAIAGLLAVALGGGGLWSIGALTGNDMVEAAVAKAQDLAQLIGQRSPGERTEALLTKTKRAKSLAKHRLAAARPAVAPKVVMTDIAKLLQAPPAVTAAPPAELALTTSPPTLGTIIVPPSGGGTPGGGGGGTPGGGGGSPGGGSTPSSFPGPESKVPITVPSAVPETQTWAMMLLGFGLIGWRVRRGSAARSKPLQA